MVISCSQDCKFTFLNNLFILTPEPLQPLIFGCFYSNETKSALLGVSPETLEKHTAVSEQTAIEMARGARKKLKTDIAVSVTGEAGPTPDPSTGCDVGTVFVGLSAENTEYATRVYISRHRDREYIRKVASSRAMREILKFLSKNG